MSHSEHHPVVSLIAGGAGGAAECSITYPFEFAKTRVQLRQEAGVPTPKNPFKVIGQVFRSQGVGALYTGCSTLVIGTIGKDAIRFMTFDTIKAAFADPETGQLSPLRSLLSGMSAGVVASTFAVTPTERIKTAMIDDARHEKRFTGPLQATALLMKEKGPLALYRGYVTTTMKQAGTTSVRMGTYNIMKELSKKYEIPQTTLTNFGNGAVAGIVTTYATQPIDCVKTRAQSAEGEGTMSAFRSILKEDGIRGMWRGSTMRLGRTVFSGGILFTVYEQVAALLNPLFDKHVS